MHKLEHLPSNLIRSIVNLKGFDKTTNLWKIEIQKYKFCVKLKITLAIGTKIVSS